MDGIGAVGRVRAPEPWARRRPLPGSKRARPVTANASAFAARPDRIELSAEALTMAAGLATGSGVVDSVPLCEAQERGAARGTGPLPTDTA